MNKDHSAVIKSIYKRKGSLSQSTIVFDLSIKNCQEIAKKFDIQERGLILYYLNQETWTLITNLNIRAKYLGQEICIPLNKLKSVTPAFKIEYKLGIKNAQFFTHIELVDLSNNRFVVSVEFGGPYNGFMQVLNHFTAGANQNERIIIRDQK